LVIFDWVVALAFLTAFVKGAFFVGLTGLASARIFALTGFGLRLPATKQVGEHGEDRTFFLRELFHDRSRECFRVLGTQIVRKWSVLSGLNHLIELVMKLLTRVRSF
jgi:hypothetical protein